MTPKPEIAFLNSIPLPCFSGIVPSHSGSRQQKFGTSAPRDSKIRRRTGIVNTGLTNVLGLSLFSLPPLPTNPRSDPVSYLSGKRRRRSLDLTLNVNETKLWPPLRTEIEERSIRSNRSGNRKEWLEKEGETKEYWTNTERSDGCLNRGGKVDSRLDLTVRSFHRNEGGWRSWKINWFLQ